MGQYYKPCLLDRRHKTIVKGWMYSHRYGSGLKLTEHSWMKNDFVGAFEKMLVKNPQRVCWAGDYADEWHGINLYRRCDENENKEMKPKGKVVDHRIFRYVVNHSKKQYVDKLKMIDKDGWIMHPLPLLTADGNGQGGGDYSNKKGLKFVGAWKKDIISIERRPPMGFKEIKPQFVERW